MESEPAHPTLRLFPLSTVLFPGAPLNLHVFEPRYLQMISECLAAGEAFGVVLIREGQEAGDPEVSPYEIGTAAEIVEVTPLDRGRLYVATLGTQRFRVVRVISRDPYLLAEVTVVDETEPNSASIHDIEREVRRRFAEYRRLLVAFSVFASDAELPHDPTAASFLIADALQIADGMKQRLLEITDTRERLVSELGMLRRLLPQLQSMVDRRRQEQKRRERPPGPDAHLRSAQEQYFGKYFSVN